MPPKDSLDNLSNMQLLSTFGEKSSSADKLTRRSRDVVGIYETAMRGLEEGQHELGRMGDHYLADNPYYIELLSRYPDFYAQEDKLGRHDVEYQKHGTVPRMIHKGYDDDKWIPRFEEAKKDTSYYSPSIMDSLVQAYGFDKLNKGKK